MEAGNRGAINRGLLGSGPMHPHLASVLDALDDARGLLKRAADAVPTHRRSERPAPQRWSTAEVLEHLSLAEGGFTSWITAGVAQARATGLGAEAAERAALPERVRTILADRVNRRNAPDRVQPTGGLTADAAWQALDASEQRLRTLLGEADGLALNDVIVPHPTLGDFNVYQWVELIASHRRRHAAQIEEILALLTGASAPSA